MGKYAPLARYLETLDADSWTASFAQVETVLGFVLPRSAYDYPAWWSNQKGPGHSQKEGWQSAGWETCDLDLPNRSVRFARSPRTPVKEMQQAELTPETHEHLWRRAQAIMGIEDRDALLEKALEALIRQETARYFTEIGGTMPEFEAALRERPFA